MKTTLTFTIGGVICMLLLLNACKKEQPPAFVEPVPPGTKVTLGKQIFLDVNLSNPIGQSCASCHTSSVSFSDPSHNMVSPGAAPGLAGNRNAPMASYTMFNPPFHLNAADTTFEGGLLWDGRVNTLEEQAMKPFVNPLEMNNPDFNAVVKKVHDASYYFLYKKIYGEITDPTKAFANIVDAIAAFEKSPELNPFTSKFDYYLKGKASFTAQELEGMNLFNDTLRSKCSTCHLTTPDEISGKILFTDFTYNSDGVPANPYNPFYTLPASYNPLGTAFVDKGLGTILNDPAHDGEFRVSSLRNIAVTAPYFHNGVFGTLEEVVHFYNKRDVPGSGIAPPEVAENVDTEETGNQQLTPKEEAAIVAFLKTLTDGYKAN